MSDDSPSQAKLSLPLFCEVIINRKKMQTHGPPPPEETTDMYSSQTVYLPTPSMMNRISSSLCKCSVQNLAQFASKFGILPGATVSTSCHCVHKRHKADWVWDLLPVNHVHHDIESRQEPQITTLAATTIGLFLTTTGCSCNQPFP